MNKCNLTLKQIFYIENLCKNLNDIPLNIASKVFKQEISSLHDLNQIELIFFINYLKDRQLLSHNQKDEIKEKFSREKLDEIFKGKVKSYDDLTFYNYKILINTKFKSKYVDHPIESCSNFEYGWQESDLCEDRKLYYLKFFDVLMLDYDNVTLDEILLKLKPYLQTHRFKIYQTYAGFHVYLVSKLINHRYAKDFMTELDCDFFYIKFIHEHGFKIRLNKKLNREEVFVEKFIMEVGEVQIIDEIKEMMKIKDQKMLKYEKEFSESIK